jgi:rSAM/selenodomain-associated transferase 1
VQIAILAKAPVAGFAKTRLIPALGPAGAARLQRALTARTLRTALAAGLGPVTLWCAPDARHRFFRAVRHTTGVALEDQPAGDLGDRMHAAFVHAGTAPLLLVGTDCPALTPQHLVGAAQRLLAGDDAVFHPAEDGGYVLVGLRRPQAPLFAHMAWSTERVMADTHARAAALGLQVHVAPTLWDVDEPADLARCTELPPQGHGNTVQVGRPALKDRA